MNAAKNNIGAQAVHTRDYSGRWRKGYLLPSQKYMPAKVTILRNGPIRIEGDFEITDFEGNTFGLSGRQTISLCRCGMAENKPFCDGTHGKNDYQNLL